MGNNKQIKRIGLFFGSFNPIHNGHISIARYILENNITDEVRLVVSPRNPLKHSGSLLEEQKRLELVNDAVADIDGLYSCDIEFGLAKPSYTYATLEALSEKEKDKEFHLIIGGDNLSILNKWKNNEYITENYNIIVYPRPGFDKTNIISNERITVINAPLKDISSTQIREMIRCNKSIKGFVPSQTEEKTVRYYSAFL